MKAKRLEKGLTQRELAQVMGIGRALLQRWELDRQAPDQEDRKNLVEILGLEASLIKGDPTAE